MINKEINHIDCVALGKKLNNSNFRNLNELIPYIDLMNITELDVYVCNAESRSQVIETNVNYFTSPLGRYIN